jgi:hypothetical protein
VHFSINPSSVPSGTTKPLARATAATSAMIARERVSACGEEAPRNRFVRSWVAVVTAFLCARRAVSGAERGGESRGRGVPACVPDHLDPAFTLDILRHRDVAPAPFQYIHKDGQRCILRRTFELGGVVDPDGQAFGVELLYHSHIQHFRTGPYLPARISCVSPTEREERTQAETIGVAGNARCSGSSAPTPFWKRTMLVPSLTTGPSWSARDGVASRRALLLHTTGRMPHQRLLGKDEIEMWGGGRTVIEFDAGCGGFFARSIDCPAE